MAVQGFGKVGSQAARLLSELGAQVIAVSDSTGGVLDESGLSIADVRQHKAQTGSVVGSPGTERSVTTSYWDSRWTY